MKKIFLLFFALMTLSSLGQQAEQTDTVHLNITVQQADSLIQANTGNPNFIVIDVRTPSEYSGGSIVGAININYYATDFSAIIDTLNRDKMYLLYCGSGSRSAKARDTMIVKHFVTVYNMLGGMGAWLSAGYPTTTTTSLVNFNPDFFAVNIYPNPVSGISTFEIAGDTFMPFTVEIYDVYGRFIKSISSGNSIIIEHNEYSPGTYVYQLIREDGKINAGKFVVE